MSKITKSAKGEACLVRVPGVCNHNRETTVLAHINGGGMGMKQKDLFAAYCCSSCHDAIDGRTQTEYNRDELKLLHLEGMQRTQNVLLEKGLIKT